MASLQDFHFLQPLWLLALLPLAGLLWFIFNHNIADNAWRKVIDTNLLPLLLNQGHATQQSRWALWLLALAWLIAVLALANPVWEKKPRPVFQTNSARVIVFDLSRSMQIADLTPSRLARARFKIEDILRKKEEGQLGLVVFAGDAFTAVPLTRDADTIRALLPSLIPKIMPIQGSRADLGLLKAAELLQQAGIANGDILLISDGVTGDLAQQAAQEIATQGHRVSVMAVGTEAGGAIPNVTDQQRNKIVVKVDHQALQAVAEQGGGVYSPLQDTDNDLRQLLSPMQQGEQDETQTANNINSDDWQEQGPLFVLLLLPLAALAFRRGWLLSIALVVMVGIQPRPVLAFEWDDLWLRADQKADKAFQQGEFEAASKAAQDPMLRGNAEYSQGNYQQAVDAFANADSTDALYNKGNALAKLGRYQEAIDVYNDVLKQQADFADANANKQHVETLLKQQQEEQKKQQQQQQQQSSDKKGKQSDKNSDQQTGEQQNKKSDSEDAQKGETQDKQQEQQNAASDTQQDKQSAEQQNKDTGKDQQQQGNAFDQAKKEQAEKEKQLEQERQEEQEAQEQQQASQAQPSDDQAQDDNNSAAATIEKEQQAKQLSREEQIAADQWLRRIPDDPGSLLQRKFKYQYKRRNAPEGTSGSQPW